MDIQIGNPTFIYLIALSAVAIVLCIWSASARRLTALQFASVSGKNGLSQKASELNQGRFSRFLSAILLALSIALLAIGLMDIRWGKTTREVPQKGIEVVFALDVSRSMLAEDATPNRLERAKQQIKDMVDEMAGDRVGLVVFAGEADQAVPLTSHYDDFKQILDTVGPHSVARGGSQLGVAIEAASEAFINKTDDHRTIVLFTDGEDQESKPVELAKKIHTENGTRIFTVGLGDMDQGARIPDRQSQQDRFVQHDGQQVWSKLNGQILQAIATETGAAYIPAGTKRVNMGDVYHGYVAQVEQTEFETAKINAYIPRFQWFAGGALFCLLVEVMLATRRRSERANSIGIAKQNDKDAADFARPLRELPGVRKAGAAAAFLVMLSLPSAAVAQDPSVASQINAANELVRQDKPVEAISAFNEIQSGKASDTLNYNLAIAHYRNSDYAAAQTLFEQTTASGDTTIAANSRYNLGNCQYASALESAKQDRDAAIASLESAISHYRSSLRLDRSNSDARANIELAKRLLDELMDQQEQEQQQQEQQNQQQQNQDQNQSSEQQNSEQQDQDNQSDSNPQQSEQEQPNDSQQQDSSQQNESQPQDSSQQDSETQSSVNEQQSENQQQQENQQQSEQQNSQPEPQGETESSSAQRQHAEQNKPAESDPAAGEEQDDAKPQEPSGELTAANEADESEPNDPKQKAVALANQQQDGLMTREEALKMLQSVRDRDMIRRLRQQQRERSRRVPVERDW